MFLLLSDLCACVQVLKMRVQVALHLLCTVDDIRGGGQPSGEITRAIQSIVTFSSLSQGSGARDGRKATIE